MSTKGKEYQLAIRIAGKIDKTFTTSLATANASLKKTAADIDKSFVTLDKGYDKIMKAGKKCFDVIATAAGVATVAITAATAGAITVGKEFETAFAGVKKTVDATEEEYAKLRQDVLDMTREIPSAGTEIAGVMEVAGQLGIAKGSLTDFTETMINLGVSTTMSAEDAATALAKFSNIVQMDDYGKDGISNYERLGSVIVDLGNNMATTEEDIVNMSTRLASYGEMAGLTEAQIMGVSAALSSVGIGQEAGGSSMGRVLMQMQQAVADGTGDLDVYAKTAGLTVSEFKALFRSDAAGALTGFIEGLGTAGEDAYGILADLDLNTIRVRQSLLSLAGGGDLLGDAIELANTAWEENTALAIEAGKRYETTDSQMQIMKNAFTELGIVAYEDLRDPFNDVIGSITDGVHNLTDYVGGPDGISKWLKNIGTALPTLQRKVKQYGEPVLEFFEPLIDIGKWFLKNPKVIVGTLAAIGSALATYKIASTLSHVVNSFMSLSKGSIAIAGVTAAIGLLVGAYAAYKQYEQEMIDQNLADHFGDISLSMEELQAVAEHIISTDSLGGVKEALAAFDDLDGIAATMEESVSEINKMNWKVSIGMELTEDEQESYKAAIESYVAAAQEYALQSRYAVSLNLSVAFDENDLQGSNVVDKVKLFYSDKYDELSDLGTQLNLAVTEAFSNGLLEFDEMEKIAKIQAQMAAIEEALATGEFDAQLSMIGMEYAGGGSLTADSFQNLQAELQKQIDEATVAYKESYAKNYAAIQATYEAGGYLSTEQYEEALKGIQQEYLQNISEVQMKGINFQIETIMQQYADELDPAITEYMQIIQDELEEYGDENMDWTAAPVTKWLGMLQELQDTTLDKETAGAISQLLEQLTPSIEQAESTVKQYEEMGGEASAAFLKGMTDYYTLNALANEDASSIYSLMGEQMVNSGLYEGVYAGVFEELESMDAWIPEEVTSGIASASAQIAAEKIDAAASGAIDPAVQGVYAYSQSALEEIYSQGFDVEADVNVLLNPSFRTTTTVSQYVRSSLDEMEFDPNSINNRATGGLATKPELTWFAENGPEMAIPIDGSQNAISLWEQTGRLLGMDSVIDGLDVSGSTGPTIEYSPTLQFYGEAPSKEDLTDALRVSQDEFEALMERYMRTHSRVSFG